MMFCWDTTFFKRRHKRITVGSQGCRDKLARFYDRGGSFSVKFGNRVARDLSTSTREKKGGL